MPLGIGRIPEHPRAQADYGSFACEICGKIGRKTATRQKWHPGECQKIGERAAMKAWKKAHPKQRLTATADPVGINREAFDDRLKELCAIPWDHDEREDPTWVIPPRRPGARAALIAMARGR